MSPSYNKRSQSGHTTTFTFQAALQQRHWAKDDMSPKICMQNLCWSWLVHPSEQGSLHCSVPCAALCWGEEQWLRCAFAWAHFSLYSWKGQLKKMLIPQVSYAVTTVVATLTYVNQVWGCPRFYVIFMLPLLHWPWPIKVDSGPFYPSGFSFRLIHFLKCSRVESRSKVEFSLFTIIHLQYGEILIQYYTRFSCCSREKKRYSSKRSLN